MWRAMDTWKCCCLRWEWHAVLDHANMNLNNSGREAPLSRKEAPWSVTYWLTLQADSYMHACGSLVNVGMRTLPVWKPGEGSWILPTICQHCWVCHTLFSSWDLKEGRWVVLSHKPILSGYQYHPKQSGTFLSALKSVDLDGCNCD